MGGGSRTAATVERCGAGPDGQMGGTGADWTDLQRMGWCKWDVSKCKMECRKLRKIHIRSSNCHQLSLCGCSFCEMTECRMGEEWKYVEICGNIDRIALASCPKIRLMSSDQLQLWSSPDRRILPGAETSQTQELQARQRTSKKPQTSQLGCWSGCVGTLVASCRLTRRL